METNYKDIIKVSRSDRGIHSQFDKLSDFGSSTDVARLETADEFRKDLTVYSITNDIITKSKLNSWEANNFGGIPLDYDKNSRDVFADSSDNHTLLIGATGSKKSRLVVMPTIKVLAAAGESMIICDPKAEIYNRTAAGLEKKGYKIGVLNLRNPIQSDSWNILAIPYDFFVAGEIDKACEFINDLTINLIPIQAKDPYWDYSARDLLFGLILLLFQICKDFDQPNEIVSIQSVLNLKMEMFQSTESYQIMKSSLWEYVKQYDFIHNRLLGTVICPDRTLSCILSTFDQHMSCFSLQPKLADMLSSSSLQLESVGFERNAIFLIMPDEKSTYHKIIAVFIKQIYEYLITIAYKKCSDNRFPVRINYILDEFSSLPAIPDFPQMITASRSRNIRFTIIVQSKHQLKQRYGEETETIQSNCGNWLFLFSREISLLNEISELAGVQKGKPLVSVFKLQHLNKDDGECLVMSGRHCPYFAHLADIDSYDNGIYMIRPISQNYSHTSCRLPKFEDLLNDHIDNDIVSVDDDNEETNKLQIELEKKFDELFGTLSESDDDN